MLNIGVLVSGGGTNLQAIIDGVEGGSITNTSIKVVISNNKNAYALERAQKHGIEAKAISPKDFETREQFNEELIKTLDSYNLDLIVLDDHYNIDRYNLLLSLNIELTLHDLLLYLNDILKLS